MSVLRTASAASKTLRSSSLRILPCACIPARLAVPPTPLRERPFSSSPSLLKKSKTQPAKPSKGKVRNEDDPSETDVDVKGALDKTGAKMQKAAEWAKTQVWEGVERARGRVSPDGIKVTMKDGAVVPLNNIASITVKQNSLFVDVWDATPGTGKAVESAIHSANMPGISPQRLSETSIKIPISRPTAEQRAEILKNLGSTIEAAKNQVRTARSEGLKLVGGKDAQGADDVQKLANDHGGALDGLLKTAKKELEK